MSGQNFDGVMNGGYRPGLPSSSSFNVKRKRQSWTAEDVETQVQKAMRSQSPKLDRRSTFPLHMATGSGFVPDIGPASDSDSADQTMMDMDGGAVHGSGGPGADAGGMDQDMMDEGAGFDAPGQEGRMGLGYNFDDRGSGGFGFGPGCEEDDEDMGAHQTGLYPSLTPHTNPNHFSNQPAAGHRATSPFAAAQAFSTTLRAPSPRGLMQPASALPLAHDASEVEKARSQHGANCKRIPKLVLSPYPDPVTGERSMWTMCEDCGAVERAA